MNQPKPDLLAIPTYKASLIQVRAYRAIINRFQGWVAEFDLTMNQWVILGHLFENTKGMRLADISKMLNVRAPFATNLVNGLERSGLVERRDADTDGRTKYVTLTASGRKLVPKAEAFIRKEMTAHLKGTTKPDLESYIKVLAYLAPSDESYTK